MNLSKDKTRVIMLTHYTFRSEDAEDLDQRIFRFLKDKVKKIVLITHPFPEFGNRLSFLTVYEHGKLIIDKRVKISRGPSFLQYLQHIFIIYYFLLFTGFDFDLCISLENMSFTCIFPLRMLGLIKRLIYYSIDFVPQRFQNPLLNQFYHSLDKFACQKSDLNWVMVKEQFINRRRYNITKENSSPFVIVPNGYEIRDINIQNSKKIDFFNIVFAGGFREGTGTPLAIETIPLLIKKFPKIKLTIIGTGREEKNLKQLISKLKIKRYVDFIGFIPSFKKLTETLASKSIGLAPYKPIPGSFSYFADPSKIKLYMSCGLPVIATNITTMTKLISKTKSGIIIDYTKKNLFKAVSFLLSDKRRYQKYKDSAITLSKNFDINHILNTAIAKIP